MSLQSVDQIEYTKHSAGSVRWLMDTTQQVNVYQMN